MALQAVSCGAQKLTGCIDPSFSAFLLLVQSIKGRSKAWRCVADLWDKSAGGADYKQYG